MKFPHVFTNNHTPVKLALKLMNLKAQRLKMSPKFRKFEWKGSSSHNDVKLASWRNLCVLEWCPLPASVYIENAGITAGITSADDAISNRVVILKGRVLMSYFQIMFSLSSTRRSLVSLLNTQLHWNFEKYRYSTSKQLTCLNLQSLFRMGLFFELQMKAYAWTI